MTIRELLIWYPLTLLLLLGSAVLLVLLRRKLHRQAFFTDADWRVLFGFSKDKLMTGAFLD